MTSHEHEQDTRNEASKGTEDWTKGPKRRFSVNCAGKNMDSENLIAFKSWNCVSGTQRYLFHHVVKSGRWPDLT